MFGTNDVCEIDVLSAFGAGPAAAVDAETEYKRLVLSVVEAGAVPTDHAEQKAILDLLGRVSRTLERFAFDVNRLELRKWQAAQYRESCKAMADADARISEWRDLQDQAAREGDRQRQAELLTQAEGVKGSITGAKQQANSHRLWELDALRATAERMDDGTVNESALTDWRRFEVATDAEWLSEKESAVEFAGGLV